MNYTSLSLAWKSSQMNIWILYPNSICSLGWSSKCGLDNVVFITGFCIMVWVKSNRGSSREKRCNFVRNNIKITNSLFFNILNYVLWGVLEARTEVQPHSSVKSLKTCNMNAASKLKKKISFSFGGVKHVQDRLYRVMNVFAEISIIKTLFRCAAH